MESYFTGLALFLLVTMAAGFVRIVRGPKPADRMLGVQLFGTTSVAILLLLAAATDQDGLLHVALVFALLSLLILIAFVIRIPSGKADS